MQLKLYVQIQIIFIQSIERDNSVNSKNVRLYISGGSHVELSPQERIDEVRSKIGSDIDVVFYENVRSNPPSRRERYKNFAAVPLMIVAFTVHFAVLSLMAKIGRSDQTIVSELAENGEVEDVDRNYHRLLAEYRRLWLKAHYGLMVGIIIEVLLIIFYFGNLSDGSNKFFHFRMTSISTFLSPGLLVVLWVFVLFIVLFIAISYFMMTFFIAGTMSTRNVRIINDIEDYIEENPDVENGCLIVGDRHVDELEKLAGRSDVITVVD